MDTEHKGCEGCSYKESQVCVIRYHHPLISYCQCKTCIVKMMCTRMCRPRRRIYISLSKKRKNELVRREETVLAAKLAIQITAMEKCIGDK